MGGPHAFDSIDCHVCCLAHKRKVVLPQHEIDMSQEEDNEVEIMMKTPMNAAASSSHADFTTPIYKTPLRRMSKATVAATATHLQAKGNKEKDG
jgi:hypothetical protein